MNHCLQSTLSIVLVGFLTVKRIQPYDISNSVHLDETTKHLSKIIENG